VQRVVPFEKQGRVFGFAASLESAAAPVSSFLIGPLAQFWLIPYMNSEAGKESLGWLLGPGEARGIALAFLGASSLLLLVVLLAFVSKPYRRLSAAYAAAPPALHTAEEGRETADGGVGRAGETDVPAPSYADATSHAASGAAPVEGTSTTDGEGDADTVGPVRSRSS
jgi:MFS transporter, DHA3 family, multidrug efflux protein